MMNLMNGGWPPSLPFQLHLLFDGAQRADKRRIAEWACRASLKEAWWAVHSAEATQQQTKFNKLTLLYCLLPLHSLFFQFFSFISLIHLALFVCFLFLAEPLAVPPPITPHSSKTTKPNKSNKYRSQWNETINFIDSFIPLGPTARHFFSFLNQSSH